MQNNSTQNWNLDGMTVAIIVDNNFEQTEMTGPREALQSAGAKTVLISPKGGSVQGFEHDKAGKTYTVDVELNNANPDDYDALLLPGGALSADKLRTDEKALDFIRAIEGESKPIAFICHAPWLIISAGLAKGRTFTGYNTIKDDIENAGGNYKDKEVVRDENWVSSRQPSDIPAFNEEMLSLFSEYVPSEA